MPKCLVCESEVGPGQLFCSLACRDLQAHISEERRLSRQVYDSRQWHPIFNEEHRRSHGRQKKKFIPE